MSGSRVEIWGTDTGEIEADGSKGPGSDIVINPKPPEPWSTVPSTQPL